MRSIASIHHITQDHPGLPHASQALSACEGGLRWVQFRSKSRQNPASLQKAAIETQSVCRQYNSVFLVNDHVELARDINADGVHLGKQDMPPDEARKILGPDKIIGGTANTIEDVHRLVSLEVDYIGIGPYRFTNTKKNLSPVLGLPGYRKIIATCLAHGITIPLIAIGGIKHNDVPALLTTGMHGVAISSAINLSTNPAQAAAQFISALTPQSSTE